MAAELALFLDIALGDDQIENHRVDMVDRHRKLVIEYDGAYRHRDRVAADIKKTRSLTAAGWFVVRIRVRPLALVQAHDLQIDKPGRDPKPVADLTLVHLSTLGFKLPGIRAYLRLHSAQNAELADDQLKTQRKSTAFREFVEHLEAFKVANGHLLVRRPDTSADGFPLGERNHFYRHLARLTPAQKAVLRRLGFVQEHWEAYFDIRFSALAEYAKECGGSLEYPLPASYVYRAQVLDLDQWSVSLVTRARRRRRPLDETKKRRLSEIPGWRWDYTH